MIIDSERWSVLGVLKQKNEDAVQSVQNMKKGFVHTDKALFCRRDQTIPIKNSTANATITTSAEMIKP